MARRLRASAPSKPPEPAPVIIRHITASEGLWTQLRELSEKIGPGAISTRITVLAEHSGIVWNSPEAAQRFRDFGSPTGQAPPRPARVSAAVVNGARRPDPKMVRAWAEAEGIACPARGRVPGEVNAAFMAAHR